MIRHKCIPLASPSEWKDTLKGIRHAFAHTWENCYAMHLTTRFETYLYCFDDGDARIVCPIAERTYNGHTDIVTPYGFSGFVGSGDCPEFPLHWRQFVRKRGYVCGYIQLNPVLENSTYFDAQDVYRYNSVYVIDLTLSLDEIIKRMDRTRRKQVKKIIHGQSKIILDRQPLTDFLIANFPDFFSRKRASATCGFSKETLAFLCNADNVLLVGSGDHDKPEAVSLLPYTPYIGEAFIQISLPGAQHHAVEMVWYRLNYLKAHNIPILNQGGGVREDDSIAEFKKRFGGMKLPLGSLKQVYEPEIYEKLCKQAQSDPSNMNGYFPPYHSPKSQ